MFCKALLIHGFFCQRYWWINNPALQRVLSHHLCRSCRWWHSTLAEVEPVAVLYRRRTWEWTRHETASLKMEKPWHPSATRLVRQIDQQLSQVLLSTEALLFLIAMKPGEVYPRGELDSGHNSIQPERQDAESVQGYHSNSVLLEFIGKKGEGDSIVSEILSQWQANGKTGSSWFWFKQDRTLAILHNLRTVSNPRPEPWPTGLVVK